jgi:type II secretory ATPase GspE/PulE/Tfp pilus assembly ATPase PilB-like protein
LRQDPDILLVGEIRDQETVRIVFQAALTGHLVLSTLHTADGCGTLHRLLEMGIEPYLITAALTAVVSQRLVRRSCDACSSDRPPAEWEIALARSVEVPLDKIREARGCEACNFTGFHGRTGLYELLVMDAESRNWINQRGSRKDFEGWATPKMFRSLLCRAVEQAARGITTPAEVVRVLGTAHIDALPQE